MEISAEIFSNVSLTCRFEQDENCPDDLWWDLSVKSEKRLQNGKKYKIEKKQTLSKCEKDFILSILNVTKSDEGRYRCHFACEHEETKKAAINLKLYAETPPEGKSAWMLKLKFLILAKKVNGCDKLVHKFDEI